MHSLEIVLACVGIAAMLFLVLQLIGIAVMVGRFLHMLWWCWRHDLGRGEYHRALHVKASQQLEKQMARQARRERAASR